MARLRWHGDGDLRRMDRAAGPVAGMVGTLRRQRRIRRPVKRQQRGMRSARSWSSHNVCRALFLAITQPSDQPLCKLVSTSYNSLPHIHKDYYFTLSSPHTIHRNHTSISTLLQTLTLLTVLYAHHLPSYYYYPLQHPHLNTPSSVASPGLKALLATAAAFHRSVTATSPTACTCLRVPALQWRRIRILRNRCLVLVIRVCASVGGFGMVWERVRWVFSS